MVVDVPSPPEPFDAEIRTLDTGTLLYRVHTVPRGATEFNPGFGRSRFAFFGDPPVPVLYAAATQTAAVAETLLHDVPLSGGILPFRAYGRTVMSRIRLTREVRVAVLNGLGLRRLGLRAEEITATDADTYPRTVAWAEAAHAAGVDGLVWTSRMSNDSDAFVFFGDRCGDAVEADPTFGRTFGGSDVDLAWLIDLCAPLRVDVMPWPRL